MKLPWTPKPKTATVEELRQQLAESKQAHADAQAGAANAESNFDESGDDASAKALAKARDAVTMAAEHVGRAERLVRAAEEREAKLARESKEDEARAMEAALSAPDTREAELLEAELDAWKRLIELRLERHAHAWDVERRRTQYKHFCTALGWEPAPMRNVTPIALAVREGLRAFAEQQPAGQRRDLIQQFLP